MYPAICRTSGMKPGHAAGMWKCLQSACLFGIMCSVPGESGENPERARRRKAQDVSVLTRPAAGTGTGHWSNLRRLSSNAPSRNIRHENLSGKREGR